MPAARLTQGTLFETLVAPTGARSTSTQTTQVPLQPAGYSPAQGSLVDRPPAVIAPGPENDYAGIDNLDDLARHVLKCRRCELRDGCRGVVFGEGTPKATLMLVGEGPGAVEDEMGRPFVGPAGKLLDKILAAAGFAREEVYIANIVKCRPPGNRLPTPQEAARCLPNLRAQIRIIHPRIIVCLGALATQTLVDRSARITASRGTWFDRGGIRILPTFHPAALLRDETKKKPVWEDFKKVRSEYDSVPGAAGGA
ncbi:MAG: uracil-DNA glycosylase [Firmicutes bacterium]|nr:uracil-DNA glycosylase [Bacillota bacterium]